MSADKGHIRRDLVLLGGGEHARVVLDAARLSGEWNVIGFTDPSATTALLGDGLTRLGEDDAVETVDAAGVVAVGGTADGGTRARIANAVQPRGGWATVIHPSAVVAADSTISAGAVLLAGVIVNPGAMIGAHAIINSGAVIEHDVHIGELTHIGPAVAVGGGARIGSRVFVGIGARIRDHIAVGDDAVIGMGAVVVANVDPGTTVIGVPARAVAVRR
jgi:acetyltransferase EpsM